MHELIATVTRGAEAALAEEIHRILGARAEVETLRGAVGLRGTLEDAYRLCLWSRLASRVLLVLRRFPCPDAEALYEGVRAVDWPHHLGPDASLAVDFVGVSSEIRNSRFGALKTKDAVVDSARTPRQRPQVDLVRPDVRINVHLDRRRAAVSIDLSGEALHRRGYRLDTGDAPLKENLAAAVLWLAGWPDLASQGVPLVDPMCGSGTLLVEAAGMALDRAPGLGRRQWGFTRWRGRDERLWSRLREEARERARAGAERDVRLVGADIDGQVVRAARRNADRAEAPLEVAHRPLAESRPPEGGRDEIPRGLVVTNPPYGERLGERREVEALYGQLGDVLRHHYLGWTAHVLAGPGLGKRIGLRPTRRVPLFNGPLECRLVQVDVSTRPVEGRGPGWRQVDSGRDVL